MVAARDTGSAAPTTDCGGAQAASGDSAQATGGAQSADSA